MHYYLTEGLGGTEHREFINNSSLAAVVRWQTTALREGQGAHYLVFSPVTEAQLTEIDGLRLRDTGYERLRFLHLNQEHVLIIKITPAEIHQVATGGFASKLIAKTMGMGMGDELQDMHGTRYQGMAGSKEADSAFKPLSFRPGEAGWPTLVIECGVSERVDRLRADAHWWLKSREGSVNIVLLFAISQAKQAIHVEKWEMVSVPSQLATSSNSDPLVTNPTQTDQIDIVHLVPATGALTLKFAQIFLRDPLPGGPEGDIVFSTSDLEQWARDSWASAQ
ncbi:hypothetical protein HOY82DRAFT_476103 [Tuber indicum]|nr:hypothetical protein HOY82DRAFT_476103 [Tuber indicum]